MCQTTFDLPVINTAEAIDSVFERQEGILRLAPSWVPRVFCTPGRRLRLHPDDYFPFGKGRGGIDERWLGSTTRADNGPRTGPYEGLSLVVSHRQTLVPLADVVERRGSEVIGKRLWQEHGAWTAFAKFFDNWLPLPFHVHPGDEQMVPLGKRGKPESYYFPPQMNNYLGAQPIIYLGLQPGVTKKQVEDALRNYEIGGDNRITDLSLGYRTVLGQGWDIPSGVLHAPSSVCTYEPQASSDVLSMFESWSNNQEVGLDLLWKDVPTNTKGDFGYLVSLLDWDANVDPDFAMKRSLIPWETCASRDSGGGDYVEKWIVFKSPAFSAKELTISPGGHSTVEEEDAYGLVAVQGHGTINGRELSSITMARVNDLTRDEYFVSALAAEKGVRIENTSDSEDLVVLKHFGPGNRELRRDLTVREGGSVRLARVG